MGVVDTGRILKGLSPRFGFGEEGRPSHDFSHFSIPFYHGIFIGGCSKFCIKKNPLQSLTLRIRFAQKRAKKKGTLHKTGSNTVVDRLCVSLLL